MKGTEGVMMFCFKETTTLISLISDYWLNADCWIKEVPKIGEWTTIDVVNEELEHGAGAEAWSTLTVFFGGRQIFKEEKPGTRELTDVCVTAVTTRAHYTVKAQPGFIRGLTIVTKK